MDNAEKMENGAKMENKAKSDNAVKEDNAVKKDNELRKIPKWDIYEVRLNSAVEGNPFAQVEMTVVFTNEENGVEKTVNGFYDGNGQFAARFMPEEEGKWTYKVQSNRKEMDGKTGSFVCTANRPENHGPVRVAHQYHFAYADGTPFYPFGTTLYAWIHQPDDVILTTLESLKHSCYNKVRMCIFPKFYHNNSNEPDFFPYVGTAPRDWQFDRFNPMFFNRLGALIGKLEKMGIEAELILFHPYDTGHWGFDRMSRDEDDLYIKYVTARLASYHNVWWSIANEYDYMKEKTKEDWDRNIRLTAENDPYHHLLSIHQGDVLYDHWNPLITHASIQLGTKIKDVELGFGVYRTHREVYHKPVIYDEVGYEGNLAQRWGSLTAHELVDKYWKAAVSGAYVTHGETFTHPEEIVWWAKGGKLRGQSNKRIAFLKSIVEESGLYGLEPIDRWWVLNGAGANGSYYLFYFGSKKMKEWKFELPAFKIPVAMNYGDRFQVDVIDTWNMTITPVEEPIEITDRTAYSYICNYHPTIDLFDKPYMAVRVRRIQK